MRRLRYLRAGARAIGSALVVAAGAMGAGACGPVEYLNQVSGKASGAVAAAKQEGAEQAAPYEYTAATEYLNKAREEGGYAEYQVAIGYGRRAEELAIRARAIARDKASARSGNHGPAPADNPGVKSAAPAASGASSVTSEPSSRPGDSP